MSRFSIFVALALLLTGCGGTADVIRTGGKDAPDLSPSATVYVAVPEPGQYEETVYHGSGRTTASIIQTAFADHARRVVAAREVESFEAALASAKERGADYLVYPTIAHWEDRATAWSGISDRVEVNIEVVDVASGRALHAAVLRGEGSHPARFGAVPEDLLPELVERFVRESYGATSPDAREPAGSG